MAIYLGYDRVGIIKTVKVKVFANTTTVSGTYSVVLNNSIGDEIDQLIIDGNSVQNGTPTPETPVEIENVGEKTKNLIDVSKAETGSLVGADGSNFAATNRARTPFVRLKKGNYTISMSPDIRATTMFFYSKPQSSGYFTGKYATSPIVKNGRRTADFPVEQDCYMRCVFVPEDESKTTDLSAETLKNYNVMIEEIQNLFDKNKVDTTRHLTDTMAAFNTASVKTYNCSDFIEVEPNTRYRKTGSLNSRVQAYFDKDKNFIEPASLVSIGAVFTTPSNCKYLVFNVYVPNAPYDDVRLEKLDASSYEPYGYNIPIVSKGKNLFDKYNANIFNGTMSNGVYTANTTSAMIYIPCEENTTYTISRLAGNSFTVCCSIKEPANGVSYSINNGESTFVNFTSSATTGTYTTVKGAKYLSVLIIGTAAKYTREELMASLQIEKGETATDYEPYIIPRQYNIYLKEPLRKIGKYVDTLDYKNGNVIRKIASDFIDTVEFTSGDVTTYKKFLSNLKHKPYVISSSSSYLGYAISNKFKQATVTYGQQGNYPSIIQTYITTGGVNRCVYTFGDSSINTITAAQPLIEDGFEVCYVLADTIEEQIDFPMILTRDVETNLEVDTEIKPTKFEVSYWEEIK